MENSVARFAYCYGCGVCEISCHTNAITIKLNKEGFFQPIVNSSQCVNCGLCLRNCSFNSHAIIKSEDSFIIKSFAAWSKNSAIREQCTSGGFCYELESLCLSEGYKELLVRYNINKNIAEHYLATMPEDIRDSIGSKYLQSYTVEALKQITKGEKYLIVGTPCMIDSIRRLIKNNRIEKDYLLVDFFCHGVPSYHLYYKYLETVKKQIGKIINVVWRSKENGWHDSWVMCIDGITNSVHSFYSKGDYFYKFYLKNRCLGKACYKDCKYKSLSSAADIRIGDLWGKKYESNDKGVNGVLVFSKKGEATLKKLSLIMQIEEEPIDIVTEAQMKICPTKPASYTFVSQLLKNNMSLYVIDKLSLVLEFPRVIYDTISYFLTRIPQKMRNLFSLFN